MRRSLRASSVDSVVRVTGNFTSETPLPYVVRESLLAAFDQGWADPRKLSQSASRAAILKNQSLENIASRLAISVDQIEVLGEPFIGHHLSISGLLRADSTFAYSEIDQGKIRAISRTHVGPSISLRSDHSGAIDHTPITQKNTVLSLQLANGETGITQDADSLSTAAQFIAIDATTSGSRVKLPARWDTALFDSRSWNGPSGLAILAIKNQAQYLYPLPRIAPIKSPGSFSLPLLIASSIALENFTVETPEIRNLLIQKLSALDGVAVVGQGQEALNHLLSCVVEGVNGENLVRTLAAQGIDIDSGSACSAEDLQPSHVLAAMGYPTDGHLRFTLKSDVTAEEIEVLASALQSAIADLRR